MKRPWANQDALIPRWEAIGMLLRKARMASGQTIKGVTGKTRFAAPALYRIEQGRYPSLNGLELEEVMTAYQVQGSVRYQIYCLYHDEPAIGMLLPEAIHTIQHLLNSSIKDPRYDFFNSYWLADQFQRVDVHWEAIMITIMMVADRFPKQSYGTQFSVMELVAAILHYLDRRGYYHQRRRLIETVEAFAFKEGYVSFGAMCQGDGKGWTLMMQYNELLRARHEIREALAYKDYLGPYEALLIAFLARTYILDGGPTNLGIAKDCLDQINPTTLNELVQSRVSLVTGELHYARGNYAAAIEQWHEHIYLNIRTCDWTFGVLGCTQLCQAYLKLNRCDLALRVLDHIKMNKHDYSSHDRALWYSEVARVAAYQERYEHAADGLYEAKQCLDTGQIRPALRFELYERYTTIPRRYQSHDPNLFRC